MLWSKEQHQRFEQAVLTIGLRSATPKAILSELNDPVIQRHHIASHLQKFRTKACRLLNVSEPADLRDEDGDKIRGMIEHVHPGRPKVGSKHRPPHAVVIKVEKDQPDPAPRQNTQPHATSVHPMLLSVRRPCIIVRDPDRGD
ncbi:hypothetical protein J8273_7503 [Carpediemonas membranifera]|uniref:HTH myb-type domain-containing protein n=1 Tax=Carpediemonas membranifera TaxID=201153 RepID=A0A8J6B224_9EUKA|nr:hypothetical protein J8273_7503 [Carpediemonas membranifera]|eukprot:KAG9391229.1 hypothetical protein J8273_7503 [Carpediemonas membranifera]